MPKVSRPIPVSLPTSGVAFAESSHAQDFQMAPRRDPYQKLLYVLQGRVSYCDDTQPDLTASKGTLLIVPSGTRHLITDIQSSTLLLFCFDGGFLESESELAELWLKLTEAGPRLPVSQPIRLQLESLWRRALLEQSYERTGSRTAIRAIALQVLVLLTRVPVMRLEDDISGRVKEVAREVGETFYDPWTLDKAAARAGISRRHFSERFRTQMGRPFAEHLIQLRLSHAATLLKAGEHSVSGVIFACGFGDVSHFYRLFRRTYKLPPKRWLLKQISRQA